MKTTITALILAVCLTLSLSACSKTTDRLASSSKPSSASRTSSAKVSSKASSSQVSSAPESVAVESTPTPTPTPEPTPEPEIAAPQETTGGIRPEFKEAMDSYEAFMAEYADFMNEYENSGNSVTMMMDYLDFLSKYAEMTEKFNAWDEGELSNEELSYYIEVNARVQQKLLEVID